MSERLRDEAADLLRIQKGFDALLDALTRNELGAARSRDELLACIDGARAALDSLASGEPILDTMPDEGSLPLGTVLANTYVVRALLGVGGTAEVYQVRHRDLKIDYAVKIPKPERARDPLVLDLIAQEAKALIDLHHDGIVRAHALLRHGDGRPFIVLDLARGPTLAETLIDGPLDGGDLRAVAYRLATSLEVLHASGLVHGDLSPENVVLVGGMEGAVLLDLGLVGTGASEGISFAGKWSSAAPERIEGGPASPEGDMYAFGLLLAASATGRRLDLGHDRESAREARRDLRVTGLPDEVAPIVGNLLDPDPRRRASAADLVRRFAPESPDRLPLWRDILAAPRAVAAALAGQPPPGSKTA